MSFLHFDSVLFIAVKMSSHQASAKARSSKCCHFCYPFDTHNYCPTSRESVYLLSDPNTSKDDLDLLGDDGGAFYGSQADLEGAAENLFSSPPRPQSLSLKNASNCPTHPRYCIAE